MAEYLVDVAAAARRLDEAQGAQEAAQAAGAGECPLGHSNAASARFCAVCGMTMGSMDLGPRVDLGAVRAAVQRPLTPEEKADRDAEHSRVLAANLEAERRVQDVTQVPDTSEKQILIHFVEDGFTWGGKVWQRGEMLSIGPDNIRWESALGWIRLSKAGQFQRYGRVFFDFGAWPETAPPGGTERPLDTAAPSRWAHSASQAPARHAGDGTNSLVPW